MTKVGKLLRAAAALCVSTAALAQAGTAGSKTHGVQPPGPAMENGAGLYWSEGDQRDFLSKQTGPQGFKVFAWTPAWRVAMRRVPDGPGIVEMHEDKTQMYVILAGSGTQVMGGKPRTVKDMGEGNHVSPDPLDGGTVYHLKPGDVVIIPPLTWHQTGADAGQSMTYRLIDIPQATRMP